LSYEGILYSASGLSAPRGRFFPRVAPFFCFFFNGSSFFPSMLLVLHHLSFFPLRHLFLLSFVCPQGHVFAVARSTSMRFFHPFPFASLSGRLGVRLRLSSIPFLAWAFYTPVPVFSFSRRHTSLSLLVFFLVVPFLSLATTFLFLPLILFLWSRLLRSLFFTSFCLFFPFSSVPLVSAHASLCLVPCGFFLRHWYGPLLPVFCKPSSLVSSV